MSATRNASLICQPVCPVAWGLNLCKKITFEKQIPNRRAAKASYSFGLRNGVLMSVCRKETQPPGAGQLAAGLCSGTPTFGCAGRMHFSVIRKKFSSCYFSQKQEPQKKLRKDSPEAGGERRAARCFGVTKDSKGSI